MEPDAAAPAGALTLAEEVAAFISAWGSFYDLELSDLSDADRALFQRCWTRARGVAEARGSDLLDYGRRLMRANQEYGATFTAPYTWSPTPALFDKHFLVLVDWADDKRPPVKAPPPARPTPPPGPKPASARTTNEIPGLSERARQLQQRASTGKVTSG